MLDLFHYAIFFAFFSNFHDAHNIFVDLFLDIRWCFVWSSCKLRFSLAFHKEQHLSICKALGGSDVRSHIAVCKEVVFEFRTSDLEVIMKQYYCYAMAHP